MHTPATMEWDTQQVLAALGAGVGSYTMWPLASHPGAETHLYPSCQARD